jgi:hypothetical protein
MSRFLEELVINPGPAEFGLVVLGALESRGTVECCVEAERPSSTGQIVRRSGTGPGLIGPVQRNLTVARPSPRPQEPWPESAVEVPAPVEAPA